MPSKVQAELKQAKPFASPQAELFVNVIRTADAFERHLADMLKASDITLTQYNVLRILRGAGTEGHKCSEIGERMITRDPDITRLLDRLEKRKLIGRARSDRDRRVVTTRITQAGRDLLGELDLKVYEFQTRMLGHMDEKEIERLNRLLDEARTRMR